jgi:hypothetical protein
MQCFSTIADPAQNASLLLCYRRLGVVVCVRAAGLCARRFGFNGADPLTGTNVTVSWW